MANNKHRLLIVEDDPEISRQLKWALADEYALHFAKDASSAMKIMKRRKPPVVSLDLGLPPNPNDSNVGMELLGRILQVEPNTKVVVVTGNSDRDIALQAIGQGAWDYYHKPVKTEELKVMLGRAFHVNALETENRDLQKEFEEQGRLDELIGSSPEMNGIFEKICKVATSDVSVLIIGESGTGKELIARSIHNQSGRRENPFVPINCGAIPDTLFEAEVFGHEKGAYTGAHVQRKGRVEYANGGTLLQVKLLRFLQEPIIERIGGRQHIEVDVRVIAATQKNLEEAMRTGDFREDLYYRLGVLTIEVPPLRSRGDDILLLANYCRNKCCSEMKRPTKGFDASALQSVRDYEWPGNVRELENRIKRAVVMSDGPVIRAEDLELPWANQENSHKESLKDVRERTEKNFICEALVCNNWNLARTADQIGVTRPTLYDLIKKHNLRKQDLASTG
jgi:two-component system NtrC family response regulator